MKILILNFRDIRNPAAGGSEVATHEMAKRWVSWGHAVTLFAPKYPGGLAEEDFEGVHIIRRGGRYTVYWQAFRYYQKNLRGRCDLVIDEINTVPFLAHLYAGVPVVALIHQLAREVWFYEARFPLSLVGYLLEPLYLRLYQRVPAMTISRSTAKDLLQVGIERVWVLTLGINVEPLVSLPPKAEGDPQLLFVGRVVPSKRVHVAIEAMPKILAVYPKAKLLVAGDLGVKHYACRLWRLICQKGLASHVRLLGYLPKAEKLAKMQEATVLLVTSVREGWGLVVVEANAMGTPAVVYNVHGLRDSVHDGETGVVCPQNTPEELGRAVVALLKDKDRYEKIRRQAWEWSRELNWDTTAREALDFLEKVAAKQTG